MKTLWLKALSFALAYLLAGFAGQALSFQPLHFVVLWLPSGIFAAVLLCAPLKRWPTYILTAAVANLSFDIINGQPLLASAGFICANCVEATSGAWLVRKFVPEHSASFIENKELLSIIAFSGVTGPAIGAAIGATVVMLSFGVENWLGTWLTWWSADGLSVISLGILIISFNRYGRVYLRSLSWSHIFEFVLALAVLCLLTAWAFGFHEQFEYKFILLPVFLWIGMRFRLLMVNVAGFVLTGLTIFFTVHVAHSATNPSHEVIWHIQAVQGYLGTVLTSMLLLASTLNSRKMAESALRRSEERLSLALDAANDGLWDWDILSGESYYSPRYYTMLGYEPGAFPPLFQSWKNLVHPDDLEGVLGDIAAHLEYSKPYEVKFRMRKKNGDWAWIQSRGRVVEKDDSGRAKRMVGTHVDISAQQAFAKALQKSEQSYRSLFMSQLDAFALHEAILDKDGQVVDFVYLAVNPSFEKLLGRPADDIVGHTVLELLPDTEKYWLDAYGRVAMSGEPAHFVSYSAPFACYFEVMAYCPQRGQYAVFARDVTESILSTQKLNLAKEKAEAANQAKSEFLATMSHEIRTPLNGVLGMLQLVLLTEVDPEQKNYLKIALQSGKSLLRVLSDVLDISKIEAGALDIYTENFHLEEVLDPIRMAFQGKAMEKGLELSCFMEPEDGPLLKGDPGRIRQVAYNLVGNALKYTDSGEVRFDVFLVEQSYPGTGRLHLVVSDTGIGVPEADLEGIFHLFTQVDGSYTRQFGGTGLGLSIVKRLVGLMGGDIDFCSRLGKGTDVHVSLPVHLSAEEAPTTQNRLMEKAAGHPSELTVLVAEDDATSRIAVRQMLKKSGYTVYEVDNGAKAVSFLAKNKVDCVLMDVQMPGMDGVEATRLIRAGGAGDAARTVPIIALTAYAMGKDREKFLAEGMDAYIAKPVAMDELLQVLQSIAPRT